jgi:hypothetical protein
MLVEAVYDNGHVLFNPPIRFAHTRFALKVDLPDFEIVDSNSSALSDEDRTYFGEATEFKELTNELFGETYQYVAVKSDQEILSEELSKKYA